MARTKEVEASSKGSEKRKRRREIEEEGEQSKKRRTDSGRYVLEVLFNKNPDKFNLFEEVNCGRKVIPGKAVDFSLFGDEEKGWTLPSITHLVNQGWKRFLKIKEPTFTRLIQVLITNLNPSSRKSWIGECEIDLSPSSLREILGIPAVQELQVYPTKGEIFSELGNESYTDATKFLPAKTLSVDLKVAHTILVHCVCPRIGSLDQVPIKEARTLWALMRGHKLDLAKIISDQLVYAKNYPRSPIPYGMFLTKVLKHFQINLKDEPSIPFRKSEVISKSTIKRMGYIFTPQGWVAKGKGVAEVAQAEGHQIQIIEQPEQCPEEEARTEAEEREIREEILEEAATAREIEQVREDAGEEEVREGTLEAIAKIAKEVAAGVIRDEMVSEEVEEEVEEEMREAALGILGIRGEDVSLPREAETSEDGLAPYTTSPSVFRSPPRPFNQSPTTPQPSLNLSDLQLFLTQSLTNLEAKLTSRIDNLEQSLNTKLETIHSLLQNHQLHTQIPSTSHVIHSPITSHHSNQSHHSPQSPYKSPSPPAKSPQPITPIPSLPSALPTPLSPPIQQPVQSSSPTQPSPTPVQPISIPQHLAEITQTTPPPSKPSPLRIPKYKSASKPKPLTPFPQIPPDSSSESSLPTLLNTRPSAPPKSKTTRSQTTHEPDTSLIHMESKIYYEMIEANAHAIDQKEELPYPEMADPAILARVRTIPSKSTPSPKYTEPSTSSRPSSSRQTRPRQPAKPRQPSKPRTPKSPAKPRQPPKPRQPRQPRQPKIPKPPTKPRHSKAQTKPSKPILTDPPTVALSSDHPSARPLLAFRHPPPPEVPALTSEPSPSSSIPSPNIYMEDEEYASRMTANQRAEQRCTLQIQQTGRYATPEYPFPELKDPSYRSRLVIKPKVHDIQPLQARPPSPQPFLPPRPLPPSRTLPPPPKPIPAITYQKKSVHKPSSSSQPPPS